MARCVLHLERQHRRLLLQRHRHRRQAGRQHHLGTLRGVASLAHRVAVLRANRQPLKLRRAVGIRRLRIGHPLNLHARARHGAIRILHHERQHRRSRLQLPIRRQLDVFVDLRVELIQIVVQLPPYEREALFGGNLLHLGLLDRRAERHRHDPPPATVREPPIGRVELYLTQHRQLNRVGIRYTISIH